MRRRIIRHGILCLVSVVILAAALNIGPQALAWERASIASAWCCLVLLSCALLVGPLTKSRRGHAPLNIYLRRDIGIWSALHSFVHFYAGNVVAMDRVYIEQFVEQFDGPPTAAMRQQLFSGGAILGVLIAVLFVVLLVISSDRALRLLGNKRWKRLQKSALAVFWLTILHAFAFQFLEYRFYAAALTLVLVVVVLSFRKRAGAVS